MQTLYFRRAHRHWFRHAFVACIRVCIACAVCSVLLFSHLVFLERAQAAPSIVGQQEPIEQASTCAQNLVYAEQHSAAAYQALPTSMKAMHARAASYRWHATMLQCPERTGEALLEAAAFDTLALRLSQQAQMHEQWQTLWPSAQLPSLSTIDHASTTQSQHTATPIVASQNFILAQDQTGYALTILAARFEHTPLYALTQNNANSAEQYPTAQTLNQQSIAIQAQIHTRNAQTLVGDNQTVAAQSTNATQSANSTGKSADDTKQSAITQDPRSGVYNVQMVLDNTQEQSSPYLTDPQTGLRTTLPALLEMHGVLQSIQSLPSASEQGQSLPQPWLDALLAQAVTAFQWGYPLQPEQLLAA